MVVKIVAQRIEEPDARKGFILDGFPRTVPQAMELDRMLAQRGLDLDAVIELRVDEEALLKRIESRIAATKAQGEPLRDDDNPDVLRRRLAAYRDQTAPLIGYYRLQSVLRSVDGMAPISSVTAAIEKSLAPAATSAQPKSAPKKAALKPAKSAKPPNSPGIGKKSKERVAVSAAKEAKAPRKAVSRATAAPKRKRQNPKGAASRR